MPILEAINAEHLGPKQSGYAKLQRMVTDGLSGWRLAVLPGDRRTHYLVTLACEGGLPLQLVVREQANLRSFFHALLTEFQVHSVNGALARGITPRELAKRVDFHLPKSLRNDIVVGLSADLVEVIAHYAPKVRGAPDPIVALDAQFPEWRQQMPLDLADDIAKAFLRGLVEDATTIASQRGPKISWKRSIRLITRPSSLDDASAAVWDLVGRLELPSILQLTDLQSQFPAIEIAGKFDLLLSSGASSPAEPVAFGTTRAVEQTVALDKLRAATRLTRGASVAGERQLLFRGQRGLAAETDAFSGARELSALPWIFVETAHSEPGLMDLIGEGSVRARAAEAFVVCPADFTFDVGVGSSCAAYGVVEGLPDRRVFCVVGSVGFVDASGARCTVVVNSSETAEPVEYHVSGKRGYFGRELTPRFMGAPSLFSQSTTGVPRRIEPQNLLWRSTLPGSRWTPCGGESLGDGFLRYVRAGEVLFQTRISILPSAFAITLEAGDKDTGVIEIDHAAGANIEVADTGATGTMVVHTPAKSRLKVAATGAAPVSLALRLVWSLRGDTTLLVPFPSKNVGFSSRSGAWLNSDASIAVTQLSRYRATASVPTRFADFHVEGRYLAPPHGARPGRGSSRLIMQDMKEVVGGVFELDISLLQGRINRLLNADDELDGSVRLVIASNSVQHLAQSTLQVKRYDLKLTYDRLMGLQLEFEALSRLSSREIDALVLRAFPIHDPLADPIVLERVGPINWSIPDDLPAGPWLVAGWDGAWCRIRPMIFAVDGELPQVSDDSLAQAILELPLTRGAAIANVIDRLGEDPDNEDWNLALGYLRWVDDFPASTFDTLRCIARNPAACALFALVVLEREPDAFDKMWRTLETLPFSWYALPEGAWTSAVTAWLAARSNSLSTFDPGIRTEILKTLFERAVKRICDERLPSLVVVFELARRRVTAIALSADASFTLRAQSLNMFATQYFDVIKKHPFATLAGRDLPLATAVYDYFDTVNVMGDFAPLRVLVAADALKESVLNAPLVAAACAAFSLPLSTDAAIQLHDIESYDTPWFSDAYRCAYLYAMSVRLQRDPTLLT